MKLQLIGKKIGMTQIYDGNANLVPVTVVQAGPCPVVQVKTTESDGYNAVQIAYGAQKKERLTKPEQGHFAKAGIDPHAVLSEKITYRNLLFAVTDEQHRFTTFKEGQIVDVIGTTKGRGFQGNVKRHNQAGQPASHGHMMHRRPGSIGMRQTPGHVFKGKDMPGHMGQVRRTTQNLTVVKIVEDQNLILIKGSVPGANGDLVYVREAKKAK